MWAIAVSILFLIGITPLASAADFPILDGDRQATIVFSTDAKEITQSHWIVTASDPYTELAACIEKAAGRRLVTVCEDDFQPVEGKFPIYVGNCRITQEVLGAELAKIDRDGFMIVVEPERVFLAGPRVWSSYWAVCQFLEDYVGVRWLMPGPLGEDIPRQERIVVPAGRRVEEPVLVGRRWSGVDDRSGAEWSLRQRVTPTSRYNRYKFSHNLGKIFRSEEYFDEHPEYFPMRDGQRFRPATGSHSNWQPCMTEPGTVQVAAQAAREAFDQDPDLEAYSFGINDNAGFCECPTCRPLWQTHGELPGIADGRSQGSTLFYSWLTKVAQELEKTHPDKLLGCLAYANNTTPPPQEVEITRRILPYITFTIADLYVPEYRDIVGNLVEAWGDRVGQIGFYDYAYGVGYVLPRIYTHLLQDTLQHGLEHSLKGVCAEVYPNWGLDAPRIYLTAALWWDPYVDIDVLFDEWNERMFREAAEPMKKYFLRCEQAWTNYEGSWDRGESKSEFDIFMRTPILEVYTPEVLAECTGYLDEAAQLAESDLVKQRLHFFRKTWDLGLVFATAYWPNQTIRRLIAQDTPVEQVAQALHKIPEAMKLADFKREVKERVGDDRLAFNPRVKDHWLPIPGRPNRSWIQDYKTDAADKTYNWFVARLTPPAIERARRAGMLRARTVQQMVAKHIREVFPTGGSSRYQEAVAEISMMATKVVDAGKAKSTPRIDGILDDGIWSQASELSDFTIRGSSMVPSECATTGRIAHDAENLYVAVECRRKIKGSGVPDIVGDLSWPEQWHVFGPLGRDDPVLPDEVLRTIPDEIEVAGRKLTAQPVTATENKFDFAPLLGGTKVGRTGYAFLALEAPETAEVTLGMGADWWLQMWLDGKPVYDTLEAGNDSWPPAISDHIAKVKMTKGHHVLAVRFISGSGGSVLALGGPNELREIPETVWIPEVRELKMDVQPTERDGDLEGDDYVAVIISSAQHPESWGHFMVNPAGALRDQRDGRNGPNVGYDFDCEWAAKVYPDRWTVELRVPLAEMNICPSADSVVRLNLVRREGGEVSTWYPEPLRGPHWHSANLGWAILE